MLDGEAVREPMRESELGRMKVAELKALLSEAGLEEKGKKAELVARLLEHEFA